MIHSIAFRSFALIMAVTLVGPIHALTFNVNTTADTVDANTGDGVCQDASGNCSLRAAVMQSNASGGADTINLPGGSYSLTIGSGSSDIDESIGDLDLDSGGVSFVGAGSSTTIIDASGINHRVFEASVDTFFFGSISFTGLTIQGGNTTGLGSSFNRGAAVNIGSRNMTLASFNDVVISGNNGGSAIESRADLSFTNSSISNNTGHGIFLTNDSAQIYQYVKELDIIGSTIEGNSVNGISIGNCDGGTLINSTVSGNGVHGFQAQYTNNKNFIITNSTIANNGMDGVAGIGFTIFDPVFGNTPVRPKILVRNSVIADNTRSDVTTPALDNQSEIPQSGGFNIVSDNSAAPNFTGPSDMNNTDPLLLAIALNAPGGTRSHAIPGDSPAIDNASASFAPATDQRGVSRPQGSGDDSGAYEFKPTSSDLTITKTGNVPTAAQGDPIIFTITVSNLGPDPITGANVADTPGADFTNASWTCSATVGSSCGASGSGDIDDSVNILTGGQLIYTLNVNLALTAGVSATNTASVTLPVGAADPNSSNNSKSAEIDIPNTPPVANGDSYDILEDGSLNANDADGLTTAGVSADDGVLANDSDIDGNNLTVTSDGTFAATGLGGTVVLAADGTFTYTPPQDVSGNDSFSYTVSDGAASSQGDVSIMVTPVNDVPSFTAGPSQHFAGGASGVQNINSWVAGFDPGPGEGGQVLLDYDMLITDPNGLLNSADVLNDGTLTVDLTGSSGTAQLDVSAIDDGGTDNGGQNTSAAETIFISVATSADVGVTVRQCVDNTGPGFAHSLLVNVRNAGPDTATAVLVAVLAPSELTLASSTPALCTNSICDLGSISALDSPELLLRFDVDPGATNGPLETMITVSALQPDPNGGNDIANITTTLVESLVSVDSFESCEVE